MDIPIFTDKDCDMDLIKSKTVAIIGYGNQGHAHALNLHDSGVNVVVGFRDGSDKGDKATAAGLTAKPTAEAVAEADLVMILTPDELQAKIYRDDIAPHLKKGGAIGFGHGFAIHYGQIDPREDIDVLMIAPKGPGHLLRHRYVENGGIPSLIAVEQNASGQGWDLAKSYASAIGSGRAAIMQTTFQDETETDLFGEQVVLCGGVTELVKAGFETLVEAGYPPELSYFECLHELKQCVDLMYHGGIADMNEAISNNAEFGAYQVGEKIINAESKAAMQEVLARIKKGEYAKDFILEGQLNYPSMKARRRLDRQSQIEEIGGELRGMMPWITANKIT